MTVAPPSAWSLLEGALRRYMAGGIVLTEDTRGFMEATFGEASVAVLQALLSDASSAERDSLLDLVFFPDPSLQVAIEPVLEEHRLSQDDVSLLAAQLKAVPVVTRLRISGTVIGVDINPAMCRRAVENAGSSGAPLDCREGTMEDIPVPDETADVVISNGVINLSFRKRRVLRETYRVLKPGGRISITDIVSAKPLSQKIVNDPNLWAS